MSYSADVFNVMIASPGDVASERAIVREVVYEWNAVHSQAKRIALLPIGWESHTSPEMGANPQTIINKQVLDKCDLLVAIFWTRIGTPTDTHLSGTVEEIERHIQSGKPAMLYFSSQPVNLDSVDTEQYAELKKFKESCRSRGLYQEYDSLSGFRERFYRHLQIKVNEHELFAIAAAQAEDDIGIVGSVTSLPALSQEASILLKEASLDPHGHVMFLKYIGGCSITVNGKDMLKSSDRREVAKWESGINELVGNDLIRDCGYKGEVFEITNLGYQVADLIAL